MTEKRPVEAERAPATIPTQDRVEFEHNFIRTAVCELRFPTLVEFQEGELVDFQRRLRKEFPIVDAGLNLGPSHEGLTPVKLMRSKDKRWTLALRASSLGIETSRYLSFMDVTERVTRTLDLVGELLDTDFFTRVGLRYTNVLPINGAAASNWVRPTLVADLEEGLYGDPEEYWNQIRLRTASGSLLIRHGLSKGLPRDEREYTLDIDAYAENVEWHDLGATLAALNRDAFSIFSWCLGPAARERLGAAKPARE